MKTFTTIHLFLLISLTLSAQDNYFYSYKSKSVLEGLKNNVSTEQFLHDSIYVYQVLSPSDSTLMQKLINRYNTAGNLIYTAVQNQYFNTETKELSDWESNWFYQYSYNKAEKLIEGIEKLPDEEYLTKCSYIFSDKDLLSKNIITTSFDGVNWGSTNTVNYEYGSGGRVHSVKVTETAFELLTEYTYNPLGNITTKRILNITPEGDSLIESKMEMDYNENQQLVHSRSYNLNGNPSLFLDGEFWYYYDNNRLDSMIQIGYLYGGNIFYHSKEAYQYNNNGKLTEKIMYYWSDGIWINKTRDVYIYNEQNILVSEISYQNWRGSINEWSKFNRFEYQIDESGKIIRKLTYQGDVIDNEWTLTDVACYFYSEKQVLKLLPVCSDDLKIFPNPTEGPLFVDVVGKENTLLLYALNGRVLYEQKLTKGRNRVKYSFSTPGIYMLKITGGDEIQIRKIIKQ